MKIDWISVIIAICVILLLVALYAFLEGGGL